MATALPWLSQICVVNSVTSVCRNLDKEQRVRRMQQDGIQGEPAQDGWFPFLHLQHTDLEYRIQQASPPALPTAHVQDASA